MQDEILLLIRGILQLRLQLSCTHMGDRDWIELYERYLNLIDCLIKINFKVYGSREGEGNERKEAAHKGGAGEAKKRTKRTDKAQL